MMMTRYIPSMVMLSVGVAVLASYVALNLVHTVTQAKGRAQWLWLIAGALAMGVGIWSMHFVGMLAFEMPGMEMAYDVPLMILSVVVAMGGSGLAIYVVSRRTVQMSSLVSGGIAMAAAIAGMHYIGMFSMRMSARIEWDLYLVSLSVLIALASSFGALAISLKLRHRPDRHWPMLGASLLMGMAIAGMHYTGMVAATFVHDESLQIDSANLLVSSELTVAVVTTTLLILGLALIGSIGQRVLALQQKRNADILYTSLALQKREVQLRTITNALPVQIAQIDLEGKVLFANESFHDWLGTTPAMVIGRAYSEVLGERYSSNYPHLLRAYKGESVSFEKLSNGHGKSAILKITYVPEFDADGQVLSVILVATDVSNYKKIEDELKSAKEAAEVANETKSAFLANMSHEIRTPLGAVLGFSEIMMSDDLSASERVNSLEVIKRNGKVLSTLINDILDLSKVEAGKLEIEKTSVVLVELLNELASLLSLEAAGKGIKLTISSEGVLPGQILTDPTRLRQILFNLIGNAIKFTEKGHVDVKVGLSADHNKIEFAISDTGIGIDPNHVPRLFAAFTQADITTTRRFGGTGLGLALSKRLAEALGGDIVLKDSKVGEGSTFLLSIGHGQNKSVMLVSSVELPSISSKIIVESGNKGIDLSRLRILLVDDSPDNLILVKKLLMIAGAKVDLASNGREGMEMALKGEYALVLMDLQMPEMDGHEATKELRKRGFSRPIIALTAHAMQGERKRCLDNGFNEHLTKPIDRDELLETLMRYT